jgi:SAM-dependent methyltransferase
MPERFAGDWLALREPADHAARPDSLLGPLNDALALCERPLHVMDLGSGAGSNLRYLAPRLSGPQHWTLVDHDADLLVTIAAPHEAVTITPQVLDFSGGPPPIPPDAGLVTASALLDLVAANWLDRLVMTLIESLVPALFALSYDGRIEWSHPHAADERVRTAVNRHQRTDKGFGPALGPDAAAYCARALTTNGLRVITETSDWRLGKGQAALAAALIGGWAEAAAEMEPQGRPLFQDWARSRVRDIADGRVHLSVGHCDMLVLGRR